MHNINSENKVAISDKIIINQLHTCKVAIPKNGYTFKEIKQPFTFSIFYGSNAAVYEQAMQQALPKLCRSFRAALKK